MGESPTEIAHGSPAAAPSVAEPSRVAPRRTAVLGSTGSIGVNALEVIAASEGCWTAVGLAGNAQAELLKKQAAIHRPRQVAIANPENYRPADWADLHDVEVLVGPDAACRIAASDDVDVVVAAIVGFAGLHSTWAALEAGKTVALANKESLVVAGPLMLDLCRRRGGKIIPVDSEHSAIFQALHAGRACDVRRIVLTASGGPFRTYTKEQIEKTTIAEALKHPTWAMGPKITVDSATMMNKALEIIEARWLFDLTADQIEVVVHPQSVVHSMVEFVDGSVVAQLSPPDMKLPIQYALSFPERRPGPAARMDWKKSWELRFEPPDHERFPAIELGLEVARSGGTAGAVLNAANEAAVQRFLAGDMRFVDVVPTCRKVLEHHDYDPHPSLERLTSLDRWARKEVSRWIGA